MFWGVLLESKAKIRSHCRHKVKSVKLSGNKPKPDMTSLHIWIPNAASLIKTHGLCACVCLFLIMQAEGMWGVEGLLEYLCRHRCIQQQWRETRHCCHLSTGSDALTEKMEEREPPWWNNADMMEYNDSHAVVFQPPKTSGCHRPHDICAN